MPTAPPPTGLLSVFMGEGAVAAGLPTSTRMPFVLVLPPEGIVLLVTFEEEVLKAGAVDVALARLDIGRGIVVFPITNSPPFCSSTGVPLIVTPAPPAVILVPLTAKAVGFGVNVWPAMV